MKKLVLILSMVTAFTIVNGQGRKVDLAVSSIGSPERIAQGMPIAFAFTVKNGGSDKLKAGDSIFYQLVINKQIAIPSGSFFAYVLTAGVDSGATANISGNINVNLNIPSSFTSTFCVGAFAINRSDDSIKFEEASTTADNFTCRDTRFGDWDAGVSDISNLTALTVYPNPANSQFYISYTTEKAADVTIRLMDLTGRDVMPAAKQRQQAGANVETINTSNLAAGVYIYQVNLDGRSQTGKITVE